MTDEDKYIRYPRLSFKRNPLLYAQMLVLFILIATMLGAIKFGADRIYVRQQLIGRWESATEMVATVTFFEDGTYRWAVQEGAASPMLHRGHYRLVGTASISLVDVEAPDTAQFTAATATYAVRVIADQLKLRNAQQTFLFVRADG